MREPRILIDQPIPKRPLGSTGEMVSLLAVGGFHLGLPSNPQVGIEIIRTAIDNGVNFLDNSWGYHNGRSEEIMGRALRDGYREKVVLMTKNDGRDSKTYKKQLKQSLARLQTECIDVVQFHEIVHEDEPKRIFEDGAIDAAVEAREDGKIRFIGFTGHKWPDLFKEMLEKEFPWDTVQMPLNIMDHHFRSFEKEILPILIERKIGVLGMKSLADGNLLNISSITPEESLRYTMSLPVSTVIVGMQSMEILKTNLQIASGFVEMTEEEKTNLLQRSKPLAAHGKYEPFKTSLRYDSVKY